MGEKSLQGNFATVLNPYPFFNCWLLCILPPLIYQVQHSLYTNYPAKKKQNILDRECRSVDTHCFAIMIRTEQLDPQIAVKHIYP